MSGFSLICCVVNLGEASKVVHHAKKFGIKGGTISIGRGVVSSRLLEFLGICEVQKEIITMIVEADLASGAIKGINDAMMFKKPHHGIAFSYSVAEFIGSKNKVNDNQKTSGVKKSMYNVIYVVVDKGKGDEVIDAANKAGARGGTIVNARGSGIHEVRRFLSMEIEPEKEEVFIVARSDLKSDITRSINSHLKIDEPGNGIMFVLDVDEVYGLR